MAADGFLRSHSISQAFRQLSWAAASTPGHGRRRRVPLPQRRLRSSEAGGGSRRRKDGSGCSMAGMVTSQPIVPPLLIPLLTRTDVRSCPSINAIRTSLGPGVDVTVLK